MKQLIVRINDLNSDAEILEYDNVRKREYFSAIQIEDLIEKLETFAENRNQKHRKKDIILYSNQIIGIGNNCVVIMQKGHKRIVTYENTAYNISFPNSIYIMAYKSNNVDSIFAYCFKEFKGKNTELYKYAMPNMLTENKICMGSAPRKIEKKDYVKALEKIIFTQYTHGHTDNIKSFKETKKYFEYLSMNEFPYDLLIKFNKTLDEVI